MNNSFSLKTENIKLYINDKLYFISNSFSKLIITLNHYLNFRNFFPN